MSERNRLALAHALGLVLRPDGAGPWCLVSGHEEEGVTMHFGCVPTVDGLECVVLADPRARALSRLSRNRVVEGMAALGYEVDNGRVRQLSFRRRIRPLDSVNRSALAAEIVGMWETVFALGPDRALRIEVV